MAIGEARGEQILYTRRKEGAEKRRERERETDGSEGREKEKKR